MPKYHSLNIECLTLQEHSETILLNAEVIPGEGPSLCVVFIDEQDKRSNSLQIPYWLQQRLRSNTPPGVWIHYGGDQGLMNPRGSWDATQFLSSESRTAIESACEFWNRGFGYPLPISSGADYPYKGRILSARSRIKAGAEQGAFREWSNLKTDFQEAWNQASDGARDDFQRKLSIDVHPVVLIARSLLDLYPADFQSSSTWVTNGNSLANLADHVLRKALVVINNRPTGNSSIEERAQDLARAFGTLKLLMRDSVVCEKAIVNGSLFHSLLRILQFSNMLSDEGQQLGDRCGENL